DYLSFAYNNNAIMHGIGAGDRPLAKIAPVGPTITGVIQPAAGQQLADQYIIEEGAIPGAFADALPVALGTNTATSFLSRLGQIGRAAESLALGGAGSYVGSVNNTQTFLTIGHDD